MLNRAARAGTGAYLIEGLHPNSGLGLSPIIYRISLSGVAKTGITPHIKTDRHIRFDLYTLSLGPKASTND